MAYKVSTSGIKGLTDMLKNAGDAAHDIAAESLYEGAGVMADAVTRAVDSIATEPFQYAAGGHKRLPSPEEKALLESAEKGVAHFRDNGGSVQTSVGLNATGYGQIKGRTKPVPMIANAINSGTSFMTKQPFYRRAMSQSKGAALSKIEDGIKSRIEKLMND